MGMTPSLVQKWACDKGLLLIGSRMDLPPKQVSKSHMEGVASAQEERNSVFSKLSQQGGYEPGSSWPWGLFQRVGHT